MIQRTITCPYCGSQVAGESTVCPGCQEDLAALAHLEYADAIHYNQALALAKEGRLREAKAELAESLTANNAFGPAYALLAKIYARELDWTNARINVKKALSFMPEDEALVRLADDVINAAPPADLASYVESVSISANPTAIDQSQPTAADSSPIIDSESGNAATFPPEYNPDKDTLAEVTQPVSQLSMPVRPNLDRPDQRSTINRKREPQFHPPTPAVQAARPSSYLYRPPVAVPPFVNTPVEPRAEPEAQPPTEPAAEPAEAISTTTESFELPFKGSIWRTLGMGILITAGLAILIRAMSGED